jgi:hypothetical protein
MNQFFGGTSGTGGTPKDSVLPRWYQTVGPVFANFVFMVVPPIGPTKIYRTACSTTGTAGTTRMWAYWRGTNKSARKS